MSLPERTVSRWAMRWREMAVEERDKLLTEEDYRLAVKTSQLLHDALDQMEGREETSTKYLVEVKLLY